MLPTGATMKTAYARMGWAMLTVVSSRYLNPCTIGTTTLNAPGDGEDLMVAKFGGTTDTIKTSHHVCFSGPMQLSAPPGFAYYK
jgi:hypothetical protein